MTDLLNQPLFNWSMNKNTKLVSKTALLFNSRRNSDRLFVNLSEYKGHISKLTSVGPERFFYFMHLYLLTTDCRADMEPGHRVTGSMGHLGHLYRLGHWVTGSTLWPGVWPGFFNFWKKPECLTYVFKVNEWMTLSCVSCIVWLLAEITCCLIHRLHTAVNCYLFTQSQDYSLLRLISVTSLFGIKLI
jgi:hypothetical protein